MWLILWALKMKQILCSVGKMGWFVLFYHNKLLLVDVHQFRTPLLFMVVQKWMRKIQFTCTAVKTK